MPARTSGDGGRCKVVRQHAAECRSLAPPARQGDRGADSGLTGSRPRVQGGASRQQGFLDMIIDCHGHYTTAPRELELFRDRQLAGLADASRRPAPTELGISDDQIRDSLEKAQLKFQRERGTDVTIFSPRAAGMAHHVGTPETSRVWSQICNDLIHRVCTLYPDNFVG